MTILMTDVSSNNHVGNQPLPWDEIVAADIKGVIVKATEGIGYVNPWVESDLAAAKAKGLGTAVYHFLRPGQDIGQQIAFAKAHTYGQASWWCDSEVSDGLTLEQVGAATRAMLTGVGRPGQTPVCGLYCNMAYLGGMTGAPWGYALWLADPSNSTPSKPALIHQYGIGLIADQSYDLNHFLGTEAQFAQLFGGTAPPTPSTEDEEMLTAAIEFNGNLHVIQCSAGTLWHKGSVGTGNATNQSIPASCTPPVQGVNFVRLGEAAVIGNQLTVTAEDDQNRAWYFAHSPGLTWGAELLK